ncbi:hypothetical protein L7F22_047477 [Adiantum nelumboides]|nr:hypothetical protein [Adiantum nelumboides]
MATPVHLTETMQSPKPMPNAQEQVAETPIFQAVPVQPATLKQPIAGSNGQERNLQAMQQVFPPPSVHPGYFGGGSIFQSTAGHAPGNQFYAPGTVFGAAQTMMPNPMYGSTGMQPGFQSTQGQFGMPQVNFGMAGITNQQPFVASPGQLNSGQGKLMNPNSVPMFQSLPYDNLTPLGKPTPYKEGGKGGNFTKASKVRKAATFLTGNAGQWWTTLLLGGQAPSTWIYFKQIFASAWLSDDFEADVMTEWHQLNAASCRNLDDYNRKFWKALLPITSYSSGSLKLVTSFVSVLVTDFCILRQQLSPRFVTGSDLDLFSDFVFCVSGYYWLVFCKLSSLFAQMDRFNTTQNEEEECVHDPNLDESHVVEIPINKLGQYFEGDESNATLPITCKGITMKRILDGGAGVSIVTRNCWETMGKPHLGVTNIVVKMANGTIAKPIGMLKDLKVNVLGHKVEDSVVRFDLTTGRVYPLGKRFIIDNQSDTTIHSAPLKYCHTCKKNIDVGENPPYLDILPGMDESDNVDWVHLTATIDTWGNRGTTWVTPEGNQIPQFVLLNMIRAVSAHSKDTRTEILTDEETSSIFEGCDSCDLMVESTIETSLNSEFDEEVNTGSSSTPSDNLSWTEEDPSEDHSTDFALGTTHNYKLDKKCKKIQKATILGKCTC